MKRNGNINDGGWMVMVTGVLHHQQPACLNTVEEACVIIRVDFRETCGCLPILLWDSRPKLTQMKILREENQLDPTE